MKYNFNLFILSLLLFIPLSIFGQPANDDLCNAQMLNVDQACTATNGDNTGATSQTGEPNPSCFSGALSSVWFSFVAPPSGVVTITTDLPIFGSLFDTEIALFSLSGGVGNCGQLNFLNEIDCNGDVNSENYFSILESVPVNPGEIHYISVSGWLNDQGSFCIEVRDGAPPPRVYVNQNATGLNNGSSWQDAYVDLQNALQLADGVNPMEVWVASGTYYPSPFSTEIPFTIKDNVSLIGGFNGTEVQLSDRSTDSVDLHVVNRTTLDGDIYQDPSSSNSQVLVFFDSDNFANQEEDFTLDGFTLTNGGDQFFSGLGGAINLSAFDPLRSVTDTIRNCKFINNEGIEGGAVYVENGQVYLANCTFENNITLAAGGAFYGADTKVSFFNCHFRKNKSMFQSSTQTSGEGGAVFGGASQFSFFRSTFSRNEALENGGAISYQEGDLNLYNCTFQDNKSDLGGGIYASGSFLALENNLAINNSADNGGFLYSLASRFSMDSSTFAINKSRIDGGAIYMLEGAHSLTNCNFFSNSAIDGGAIFNSGGTPKLLSCGFYGNFVDLNGGAIHNDRFGNIALDRCLFIGNFVTSGFGKGGAMYNSPQSVATLLECRLENNFANEGGGAISNEQATIGIIIFKL